MNIIFINQVIIIKFNIIDIYIKDSIKNNKNLEEDKKENINFKEQNSYSSKNFILKASLKINEENNSFDFKKNFNKINDDLSELSTNEDLSNKNYKENINYSELYLNQNIDYEKIPKEEIIKNCNYICKNQKGCRYLQQLLDENHKLASSKIFYLIKNNIKDISTDSFGNYFVQKVIKYLNNNQIKEILNNINKNFLDICFNQHGTRVIQKLIDKIQNDNILIDLFNDLFLKYLLEIILNPNSTHIVIKYISLIKYPYNEKFIQFIKNNLLLICTNKYSCCTLQKIIENLSDKKELLYCVSDISSLLFNDQYGNYVIQFILTLNDKEINNIIIKKYLEDFNNNVSNKFSSNIFSKCLEYCNFETKEMIIKNLCNYNSIKFLLYNMYGNYVLQQIISVSNEPYKSTYIKYIAMLLNGLLLYPFGNVVLYKLKNTFPELNNYINMNDLCYKNNF